LEGHGRNPFLAKIIARKVPAKIEYEDDSYIVIQDIKPAAPVHVLVIPKKQIASLNEIGPGDRELVGGLFFGGAEGDEEAGA